MDNRPPLVGDLGAFGSTGMNSTSTSSQRYPAPTSLQIFAIAIIFFFPALALVVVIIRAVGRITLRQFGWDDWLICTAMFLSIVETIVSYFFIKTNFVGIHAADIPRNADPTQGLIWLYAVQLLYNPVLSLVKSSVLVFLQRLFGQKDEVRRFIIGLNVVNIVQMVAVLIAVVFQCTPIPFNWDLTISNGRCVDRRILYVFTACFNIVTDLLVLGLPLWIFVDLKIPRRTKIALIFVFLLGFIVTIASVVRLVLLVQGLYGLVISSDPTFNIGFVVSAIETNLALITASAPALRPFFRNRDRGGWIGRPLVAPSKPGDIEAATSSKPFGWPLSAKGNGNGSSNGSSSSGSSSSTPRSPLTVGGSKLRRGGGSRGARRGGSRGGRGRGGAKKYDIRLRRDAAELRGQSPRASEEEAMTANGIMRVSDIQREIDGIVREIAVEGAGTYTGRAAQASPPPSSSGRGGNKSTTAAPRLLTNNLGGKPTAATATAWDANLNDFRNTGFDFFNRIPPPSAEPGPSPSSSSEARRQFPERYYSESVYPDTEYHTQRGGDGAGERDYSEERISKYGEKRFGVVTPKSGMTPTSGSGGWRESGRPF